MKLKMWLASLLLAFTPAVASAVTLIGEGTFAESTTVSESFTYENDISQPLSIRGFGLTFTNSVSAAFLEAASWSFTGPGGPLGGNFMTSDTSAPFFANVSVPAFVIDPDEQFTVSVTIPGSTQGTSGGLTFTATAVPLPAAGWMLLSALGGVAFISRRQKKVVA